MIRRHRRPQLEIINECLECREPGPRHEWLTFSVEVKQGPRGHGGTEISLSPTYIVDLIICPRCLHLPKYEVLRNIFSHPEAQRGLPEYNNDCVVICRHQPYGYHKETPRHRRVNCPNCWHHKATVWSVKEALPLAIVSRWWDTVTERTPGDEVEISDEVETSATPGIAP